MNIDIRNLSIEEKLRLIVDLWDSIDPESIPLTDEEKKILDQSLREFEENPVTHKWEEIKLLLNQIVS